MPGVSTSLKVRTGPGTDGRSPASTAFMSGLTERGRAGEAVLIRSVAEFVREFGGYASYSYAYDAVRTFFEEGGTRLYFVRVVGDAATTGFRVLMDRAGTPVATLRLDARGAGAWSSNVLVAVQDGSVANTFRLVITSGNETPEVYDNLATPAQAAAAVNARSAWVTATDQGSASAGLLNQPMTGPATALSAGGDDRASVVATDYVAALDQHASIDLGAGAVAIPGQPASTVGAALIAHARANKRVAILAPAAQTTVANAVVAAQALTATPGSEYAALVYPWVSVADGAGGVRSIPPEGFALGVRARAHDEVGPWAAPAGDQGVTRSLRGVERTLTRTEGDQLDAANVSAIRVVGGAVKMYGWRSLSTDMENWAFLNYADLMNFLQVEGEKLLEQFVFDTIDARGQVFGKIAAEMVGLVEPIRRAGGLFESYDNAGNLVDPGYRVNVGASVNTLATMQAGQARVEMAVRPSPVGAEVVFMLTKAALTAAV